MRLLKDSATFWDDLCDFDDIYGEFGWWDIQQAQKFEILIRDTEVAGASDPEYEK